MCRVDHAINEVAPVFKVRSLGGKSEAVADEAVKLVAAKVEWAFVNRVVHIAEGDHVFRFDVSVEINMVVEVED